MDLHDDILQGADQIAEYVFGDRKKKRRVYRLKDELPLFWLGGMLCGRKSAIREHIESQERR